LGEIVELAREPKAPVIQSEEEGAGVSEGSQPTQLVRAKAVNRLVLGKTKPATAFARTISVG
jgi:hypothetical protein